MQQAYGPPGGGMQSQIVCGGCRTLLMYPQGAHNVRCARCSHITRVPPPPPALPPTVQDAAQLQCNNPACRVVLMYPRGASQVQCSMCGTLNCAAQANQLGHLVCGGCQITLAYAYGAISVKCAVCNHVTAVPPHGRPAAPAPAPAPPGGLGPGQTAVLVENPPTLDDAGNEVKTMALGVTTAQEVR